MTKILLLFIYLEFVIKVFASEDVVYVTPVNNIDQKFVNNKSRTISLPDYKNVPSIKFKNASMSNGAVDRKFKSRVEVVQPEFLQRFPRYEEMQNYLSELARTHSDVVSLFSIGKSFENREILAVKISSGGDGQKPALLIDAGIHAREWIAPTTALYAIRQLVENSANRYVFEDIDVYIIPLLNPDGYEYTHRSTETRFWRKSRSKNSNSGCLGTDLNRNFYNEWTTAGISSDPCSQFYGGPHPFSEPESRALRDFLLKHKDQIKVYLSLHSYGQYIMHPWGYRKEAPGNNLMLKYVAEKAKSALSKVRGTQYRVGSVSEIFNLVSGGSIDWAMRVADLAYAIELPPKIKKSWIKDEFDPPTSEIEPVGRETFEAFKVFASYVRGKYGLI